MKLRYYLLLATVLLCVIAAFTIVPVPTPEEKDCLVTTGIVNEVDEGGSNDIVFQLKGTNRKYYINRGLEAGLTINELRKDLMGKSITIKYPDYSSPILAGESIKHLSKLEFNGKVIYSELD